MHPDNRFHRPTRTSVHPFTQSLFVCLSIRSHISKITRQNFTRFLYLLPVAVSRSSSDGSALCYVLPVLWMTSCFHIMEEIGPIQRRRVCFIQFARWRTGDDVCRLRVHLVGHWFWVAYTLKTLQRKLREWRLIIQAAQEHR